MVAAKRSVALFLLAFGVAMAIASLADHNWVSQKQLKDSYGEYRIGLQQWQIRDSARFGDSEKFDLTEDGTPGLLWNENLLGSRDDWHTAGEGALGIGIIGLVLLGLSALFALANIVKPAFSKAPAAFLAFLAGVCFLIGAIIYEGVRPSWGGDMGYNYPMGLYLAAGLMGEIAAIVLWSADYTKPQSNAAAGNAAQL
jgi:hypothetical protein